MMYGNFTERELDAFWMGVESEQTRIIKLLEQLDEWDWIERRTTDLIALIKGEQK